MSPFLRWCKFNGVGALGAAVQLAALASVNRLVPGHPLCATAVAVELTLVHNFIWHIHTTWRDRRHQSSLRGQFIRFQVSNGLVSLMGNLMVMRMLAHNARIPLLVANGIAILGCSIVNFCLGNAWAFPVRRSELKRA